MGTPRVARERSACILFEHASVHGLYVAEQPLLAAHAANQSTCLVADFGSDCVDICPVVDGRALHFHGRRLRHSAGLSATRALSSEMGLSLADAERAKLQAGISVTSRGVKRQSLLAPATAASTGDPMQTHHNHHHGTHAQPEQKGVAPANDAPTVTLPDGQQLSVPADISRTCGDAMMDSSPSPGEEATAVVNSAPTESRSQLCENVLATGGCAGAHGLQDRLVEDMQELLPPNSRRTEGVQGAEYMPFGWQQNASWLGGAILAKVVFSQNMHCSKFDYAEMGPSAIWRKQH